MVSTHAAQYIQDCPPSTTETGKSPLALLAKTCETIGLPDAPTKKTPEKEKKLDSPRRKDSPRAVRDDSKPFPFLPFPYMPMMPMMPPMPFFPSFKPGCASALVGRPCIPGQCCPPTPMDMYNPLNNPLYAAYAGMMPSVSGAPSMPSYQSLLAATAAQSQSTAAASAPVTTTAPAAKLSCSWTDGEGVCGKNFSSAEELASHVRSHASSPKTASTTASPAPTATPARSTPVASPAVSTASAGRPPRFHPYSKPMLAMPPMGLPMPGLPFPPHMFNPLQAMFQQRLLPSMPMP